MERKAWGEKISGKLYIWSRYKKNTSFLWRTQGLLKTVDMAVFYCTTLIYICYKGKSAPYWPTHTTSNNEMRFPRLSKEFWSRASIVWGPHFNQNIFYMFIIVHMTINSVQMRNMHKLFLNLVLIKVHQPKSLFGPVRHNCFGKSLTICEWLLISFENLFLIPVRVWPYIGFTSSWGLQTANECASLMCQQQIASLHFITIYISCGTAIVENPYKNSHKLLLNRKCKTNRLLHSHNLFLDY